MCSNVTSVCDQGVSNAYKNHWGYKLDEALVLPQNRQKSLTLCHTVRSQVLSFNWHTSRQTWTRSTLRVWMLYLLFPCFFNAWLGGGVRGCWDLAFKRGLQTVQPSQQGSPTRRGFGRPKFYLKERRGKLFNRLKMVPSVRPIRSWLLVLGLIVSWTRLASPMMKDRICQVMVAKCLIREAVVVVNVVRLCLTEFKQRRFILSPVCWFASGPGISVDARNLELIRLVDVLRNYLIGKRFILGLDDVWEKDVWIKIMDAFLTNCFSRFVLTSRKYDCWQLKMCN